LQFLYREDWYQISTNFVQSKYENSEEYPCQRYKIADRILRDATVPSVDLIRSVLSATHSDYISPTLYSNICDLKKKRLYLYFFHNFEEEVVFDLNNELKKGEAEYPINSLFNTTPFTTHQFKQIGPQIGAEALMRAIYEKGIRKAIKHFNKMKEESRNIPRYIFEEWVLRDVGYILSANNRTSEAAEIFKLNTQLHPESRNADRDLSIAHKKVSEKI